MENEGFYLQLPSNGGDPLLYPDNTLTNYTTNLARRIELDGKWAVAVCELSYPHSFIKLSKEQKGIIKVVKNPFRRIVFPKLHIKETTEHSEIYSLEVIVPFINNYLEQSYKNSPEGKSPLTFDISDEEGVAGLNLHPNIEIVIQNRLALLLGFLGDEDIHIKENVQSVTYPVSKIEPQTENWWIDIRTNQSDSYEEVFELKQGYYLDGQNTVGEINKIFEASKVKKDVILKYQDLSRSVVVELSDGTHVSFNDSVGILLGFGGSKTIQKTLTAPYPLDLNIGLFSIYIYSDLIASDQIVGSQLVPLLRSVPVRGADGDVISEFFQNLYYRPLIRNSFHEVTINLRDDSGSLIHFSPNGRVNITLHFKKIDY